MSEQDCIRSSSSAPRLETHSKMLRQLEQKTSSGEQMSKLLEATTSLKPEIGRLRELEGARTILSQQLANARSLCVSSEREKAKPHLLSTGLLEVHKQNLVKHTDSKPGLENALEELKDESRRYLMRLGQRESQVPSLQKQLETAQQSSIESTEKAGRALDSALASCHAEHKSSIEKLRQQHAADVSSQTLALKGSLSSKTEEAAQSKIELEKTQEHVTILASKFVEAVKQYKELQLLLEAEKARASGKEEEDERLRYKSSTIQDDLKCLNGLKNKLRQIEERLAASEATANQLPSLQDKNTALQRNIDMHSGRLIDLEKQLEQTTKRVQDLSAPSEELKQLRCASKAQELTREQTQKKSCELKGKAHQMSELSSEGIYLSTMLVLSTATSLLRRGQHIQKCH